MPPTKTVEKLGQVAKKRAEETDKENEQARRKAATVKMQEDMRNGGATAHKAVKGALADPKAGAQGLQRGVG